MSNPTATASARQSEPSANGDDSGRQCPLGHDGSPARTGDGTPIIVCAKCGLWRRPASLVWMMMSTTPPPGGIADAASPKPNIEVVGASRDLSPRRDRTRTHGSHDPVSRVIATLESRGYDPRPTGVEAWESRCPGHNGSRHNLDDHEGGRRQGGPARPPQSGLRDRDDRRGHRHDNGRPVPCQWRQWTRG